MKHGEEDGLQRGIEEEEGEDEDEDEGSGYDDEGKASADTRSSDDGGGIADASFMSDATVPGAEVEKFSDLTIVHTRTYRMRHPGPDDDIGCGRYRRRGGRKPIHECLPAFIEIKNAPTRFMKTPVAQENDPQFLYQVLAAIVEAMDAMVKYIVNFFRAYPSANGVLVICAAGPFWRWSYITRGEAPVWYEDAKIARAAQSAGQYNAYYELFSMTVFELCTRQSDDELNKIFRQYVYPFAFDHH